jgi:hypothetical protein
MMATLLTNETPGLVAAAWLLVARRSPGSDGGAGSGADGVSRAAAPLWSRLALGRQVGDSS